MAMRSATPAGRARTSSPPRQVISNVLLYGTGLLIAILALFPILWTLSNSLKGVTEVFEISRLLPRHPQWHNYVDLLVHQPFGRWLVNSVEITILATAGTVISSMLVGYSFARFRFPGRNLLFLLTISTLILPAEVTIVPNYLLFRWLGWLDTYLPLIVPYWLGGTAFFIFLFRQFFLTIPREFDEAARIDGANSLQILVQILAPMSKPAIGAAVVISFIQQWGEFFTPLIYLNTPAKYTLSIGLRYFYESLASEGMPMINLLMAGAIVATLPPILLFIATQRYFIEGMVMSGLKR